jgi:4-hydroxymandelate oxidase
MTDLAGLLSLQDFEAPARQRLPREVFEYFAGGAEDELALARNVQAWRRCELWPRVLVDVSRIETGCELLGQKLALPVVVAPMAYQRLAHPEGELALARACRAAGAVYCASTMATTSLEDIARSEAVRWFQLYVHKDRHFTLELVRRAEAAGYAALVLTVDLPVFGRRPADQRNRFDLPQGMTRANFEPALSAARRSRPDELSDYFAQRHDASFSWKDLDWLLAETRLPVLLKGVLRADDAQRAVIAGVAGLIVSNHGGRQLDSAPSTLDALRGVVVAAAGHVPVLVDGGVRRGSDIVKALALGADAVMLGRPLLWGLALGGEAGCARVFEILREELENTMALCGCARLEAVSSDLLRLPGQEGR